MLSWEKVFIGYIARYPSLKDNDLKIEQAEGIWRHTVEGVV